MPTSVMPTLDAPAADKPRVSPRLVTSLEDSLAARRAQVRVLPAVNVQRPQQPPPSRQVQAAMTTPRTFEAASTPASFADGTVAASVVPVPPASVSHASLPPASASHASVSHAHRDAAPASSTTMAADCSSTVAGEVSPPAHPTPVQPRVPEVQRSPARQLADAMQLARTARILAGDRIERRHAVAVATMVVLSLGFVALSIAEVVYAPVLDVPTMRTLTLVAIVTSILSLVVGLFVALTNDQLRVHLLRTCAVELGDLQHELAIAHPAGSDQLKDILRHYHAALKLCPYGPLPIDIAIAKLATTGQPARAGGRRLWLRLRRDIGVYGPYALLAAIPPLLFLALSLTR